MPLGRFVRRGTGLLEEGWSKWGGVWVTRGGEGLYQCGSGWWGQHSAVLLRIEFHSMFKPSGTWVQCHIP